MFLRTAVAHQAPPSSWSRPASIPMDAWREENRFVIALDLPGIAREAIEVKVHGRTVTVTAERRRAPRGEGARTELAERAHGVFTRRIQLADTLNPAGLEARSEDGVLTLTVPLASASRSRKISVQSGDVSQPAWSGRPVPAAA
ncbi:Hsp20/alpha crystallin family protein [Streptacidiphilus neutrinimicus]|uniref:Hsp20/alpha crystallin family protein n=1 Tax=Streptacidiphilus neutrinimicus TaxID=105420 RepID=UPI0005A66509|nr:Hsp20/alpha crystallin family protein [Streptacidiphilus neutrinimicus]